MRIKIIALPAFLDNYIWMLHDGESAVVVDPGDAQVVLNELSMRNLNLTSIFITHHHGDHTGGVADLRKFTGAKVFGPLYENMPEPLTRLGEGDCIEASEKTLGLKFHILAVPGHTAGHIAYYCDCVNFLDDKNDFDSSPVLFCGDTLFSAGCGRLFEGTPKQMLNSLDKLAQLPSNTLLYCAHEYTISNIAFAQTVEPDNKILIKYRLQCQDRLLQQLPTLPSSIGLERTINPFLRVREDMVKRAVQIQNVNAVTAEQTLYYLRLWKDNFVI